MDTALTDWSVPAIGSLERYVAAVNAVPMLAEAEERELARRMREERDRGAAERLVVSHLRLVVRIARGYDGYGLPLGDLVQEGTVGLMTAVRRFDPERSVRLAAYAAHYIRAAIHEFVLRNWRIVRIATTKAQRKLFFNLRRLKRHDGLLTRAECAAIADELDVDAEAVREMEVRLRAHDAVFAVPEDEDSPRGGAIVEIADYDRDPLDECAAAELGTRCEASIAAALARLDARSRDIVECRWLADERKTLETLAARYRVSRERIRQIEAAALETMRRHLVAGDPALAA